MFTLWEKCDEIVNSGNFIFRQKQHYPKRATQKKMGYNAAEALYKRVQANLAKKRENPDDEE